MTDQPTLSLHPLLCCGGTQGNHYPGCPDRDDIEEYIDELDDFDSNDFDLPRRSAGTDYLQRTVRGLGFGSGTVADDLIVAHGMVQSFLNAFARDGRYELHFDPKMQTAGTNLDTRRVVVTPAPILDPDITREEAAAVLIGLACHEISHPRYGKNTWNAVKTVFKNSSVAHDLSNMLDDVRIEQRFVEDYPGYSGVFDPPMKYITKGLIKRNGGAVRPSLDNLVALAGAAVRYPTAARWEGFEEERDWWQDWARRYAREDSPRRHVEGIREAMRRIVATKLRRDAEREEEKRRRREEEAKEEELETDEDGQDDDDAPDLPTDGDEQGFDEADDGDPTESDDGEEDGSETGDDRDEPADDGASEDEPDEDGESDPDDQDDETGPGENELDTDDYDPPALEDDPAPADDDGEATDDDEPLDADGLDGEADDEAGGDPDDELVEAVEEMSDEELADEAGDSDMGDGPTCAGSDAIAAAAEDQGVNKSLIDNIAEQAEKTLKEAEFYEDDGQGGVVDVARSMKGMIHGPLNNRFSRFFKKSDVAARYIRDALMQSRSGHTDVSRYQKRGRIDQQALHRVAQYDYRLFDRKKLPSPGRFLVWIMLDRSASMDGTEALQQAQVATAIADATRHVKTVRAAVWAWSDNFRDRTDSYYNWKPSAVLAWRTGQPTNGIAATIDLPGGNTPDSQILGWASRAILREARVGEQPVIIFCSDGWGAHNLGEKVAEARKMGVHVVSVAFGALDEESQLERFGRHGYVPWQGTIVNTARPLAKLVARMVGHDRRG